MKGNFEEVREFVKSFIEKGQLSPWQEKAFQHLLENPPKTRQRNIRTSLYVPPPKEIK